VTSPPNPAAAADIAAILDPARYGARSSTYDEIVAAAESHYWDPDDPRYVDLAKPFDLEKQTVLPPAFTPELLTAAADRLDGGQRVAFANELARFHVSQLLHGEQAAVALCGKLCTVFLDGGEQEYAANQAREEARHVRALGRYVARRWGAPLPAARRLGSLLMKTASGTVHQIIIAIQIMLEGVALGMMAALQPTTADPVLGRILQLMLTDEAYHHRFGQIWGEQSIPRITAAEREQVENWAAACFVELTAALYSPEPRAEIYRRFGFEPQWIAGAIREAFRLPALRQQVRVDGQLRILVRTLVQTGIMTERTRPLYQQWFNVADLARDQSRPEDAIAEQTTAELREINRRLHDRVPRPRR
jgi:hypothetical protein